MPLEICGKVNASPIPAEKLGQLQYAEFLYHDLTGSGIVVWRKNDRLIGRNNSGSWDMSKTEYRVRLIPNGTMLEVVDNE